MQWSDFDDTCAIEMLSTRSIVMPVLLRPLSSVGPSAGEGFLPRFLLLWARVVCVCVVCAGLIYAGGVCGVNVWFQTKNKSSRFFFHTTRE